MSDELEANDVHVVVKRADRMTNPWRWEIWVAGRSRPVERSTNSYATMSEATREGKTALRAFLEKHFPSAA